MHGWHHSWLQDQAVLSTFAPEPNWSIFLKKKRKEKKKKDDRGRREGSGTSLRIHNYKIYRISTNYGEPSRLRSVFVLKMHGWRNRFQKVWLVLFFTLWAWQMDLLCKIKPRKPYKIKQKKKKKERDVHTDKYWIDDLSGRAAEMKRHFRRTTPTYIHTAP